VLKAEIGTTRNLLAVNEKTLRGLYRNELNVSIKQE